MEISRLTLVTTARHARHRTAFSVWPAGWSADRLSDWPGRSGGLSLKNSDGSGHAFGLAIVVNNGVHHIRNRVALGLDINPELTVRDRF